MRKYNEGLLLFCLIMLWPVLGHAAATTTFTGTGHWTDAGRWSNGVPTTGKDAVIATGAVCSITANAQCNNLSIRSGAVLNVFTVKLLVAQNLQLSGSLLANSSSDSITVNGTFMGNGSLILGSGGLLLYGPVEYAGILLCGTSTIAYYGSQPQTVLKGNYCKLAIGGAGNKTITDTVYVSNTLRLLSASLALGNGLLEVGGTIEAASGKIEGSPLATLVLSGGNDDIETLPMAPAANMLGHLIINKTGGTQVSLSSSLGIAGSVKIITGQLYTNGYLTLLANANGQASIEELADGTVLSGAVTVQKYIPAGSRRWIHLGMPVQGATYQQLLDDIFITGTPASVGFDHNSTGKPSLYTYDESVPGDEVNNGWIPPLQASDLISERKALKLFFRGDRSDSTVLTNPNKPASAALIDLTGVVNRGTINIPVKFTNTQGGPQDDGWNFIANPYPCNIDWEASGWQKKHIESTIWIWNPYSNTYGVWNKHDGTNGINSIIPQGGGFWVKARNANASLTLTEEVKTMAKAGGDIFCSGNKSPNHVHIQLERDSLTHDQVVLSFEEGAVAAYADSGDALKLRAEEINLWTTSSDGYELSMNRLPIPHSGDTIGLRFDLLNGGLCALRFREMHLVDGLNLLLLDHFTGKRYIVTDGFELKVLVNEEAASRSLNRFQLLLIADASSLELLQAKPSANCSYVTLLWHTAYEFNNRHYHVERSMLDSLHFSSLDEVLPHDTLFLYPYAYAHTDPISFRGKAYYRIAREFMDGHMQYSNILSTDCTGAEGTDELSETSFRVYPVPFSNYLMLHLNNADALNQLQVRLFDASGRTLMQQTLAHPQAEQELKLPDTLVRGLYFLELKSGADMHIVKIAKQ